MEAAAALALRSKKNLLVKIFFTGNACGGNVSVMAPSQRARCFCVLLGQLPWAFAARLCAHCLRTITIARAHERSA
jgi:hypothetical protein